MSVAISVLVAVALTAEGAPVNGWTGADPSGACKGTRIVRTPSGKVFSCVAGAWAQTGGDGVAATGSDLPRSSADRAGDYIDAADFSPGLVPSTNSEAAARANTASIRAALTRCNAHGASLFGGSEVSIPAGTYYINEMLELVPGGCSGLRGLNGTATLVWRGSSTGKMVRMATGYQRLTDITLRGGSTRPANGNGVVGVWMYDASLNHVKDRFRNVNFEYLSVGVKAERPNPASGGQNEGTSFADCRFYGDYIGVMVTHGNVDYWTFLSTYWTGNVIGVYVNETGDLNQWTFVGCIATDNLTDPYSSWVTFHPDAFQAFGNLSFINCQTEQVQWMADAGGRRNISLEGSQATGMLLHNLTGEVTWRAAFISPVRWTLPQSQLADGVTTDFRFTFPCTSTSRIQVIDEGGDGGAVTWDYVNGVPVGWRVTSCTPHGGTVHFDVAPGHVGVSSSHQPTVIIYSTGSYTMGTLVASGYFRYRDLGATAYFDEHQATSTADHVLGDLHTAYFWQDKSWYDMTYHEDLGNGAWQSISTYPLKLRIPSTLSWAHLPALDLSPTAGDPAARVSAVPQGDVKGTVSSWTTGAVLRGYVRMNVNGTDVWMPYYSAPTGP